MKITSVDIAYANIPLKRTFKTALRESGLAQSVLVRICGENGICGYGEAAVTPAVTGETALGITSAIRLHLTPCIIGQDTSDFEYLLKRIYSCILHNTGAKAAVDTALYDLKSREAGVPLYKFLGGTNTALDTCITISLNSPIEMTADSIAAVKEGFSIIKLKLGGNVETDIARVSSVRAAVGASCRIFADANQGWGAKQAVRAISQMEDMGLNVEVFEQPVPEWNLDALRYVTQNVLTPVIADESVFSHHDAAKLFSSGSADMINIKLMKSGGIYGALQLCETAQAFGVECMLGCMLETGLSVNAAAALALAKPCITRYDLDAPFLCREYPYKGAEFSGGKILLTDSFGTGCDASAFFAQAEQ